MTDSTVLCADFINVNPNQLPVCSRGLSLIQPWSATFARQTVTGKNTANKPPLNFHIDMLSHIARSLVIPPPIFSRAQFNRNAQVFDPAAVGAASPASLRIVRSEERRVGKECRSR